MHYGTKKYIKGKHIGTFTTKVGPDYNAVDKKQDIEATRLHHQQIKDNNASRYKPGTEATRPYYQQRLFQVIVSTKRLFDDSMIIGYISLD